MINGTCISSSAAAQIIINEQKASMHLDKEIQHEWSLDKPQPLSTHVCASLEDVAAAQVCGDNCQLLIRLDQRRQSRKAHECHLAWKQGHGEDNMPSQKICYAVRCMPRAQFSFRYGSSAVSCKLSASRISELSLSIFAEGVLAC
jgi:hypothetical protein